MLISFLIKKWRAWRERQAKTAFSEGYHFAKNLLRHGVPDAARHEKLIQNLEQLSDGSFNRTRWEREFDKGIKYALKEHRS